MNHDLRAALERLCAYGRRFDRIIPVLNAHRQAATPILVRLLGHGDPGWRKGAATALERMRATPSRALPALRRMLRSADATEQISAIAAMDWLPARSRLDAVADVARLLRSSPKGSPAFTMIRAHLPRAVGAHFLGLHGGDRGVAALSIAARRRTDPVAHHIEAALRHATARHDRPAKGGARGYTQSHGPGSSDLGRRR